MGISGKVLDGPPALQLFLTRLSQYARLQMFGTGGSGRVVCPLQCSEDGGVLTLRGHTFDAISAVGGVLTSATPDLGPGLDFSLARYPNYQTIIESWEPLSGAFSGEYIPPGKASWVHLQEQSLLAGIMNDLTSILRLVYEPLTMDPPVLVSD